MTSPIRRSLVVALPKLAQQAVMYPPIAFIALKPSVKVAGEKLHIDCTI